MTLFGTELGVQEIASLCGLLAVLALWIGALRRERSSIRWFRNWEAARKARRDAEIAGKDGDGPKSGPWG
jgi:hypothetical protein